MSELSIIIRRGRTGLFFLCMLAALAWGNAAWGQDAEAAGSDPDFECDVEDIVWSCSYNDETPWGYCDYMKMCMDSTSAADTAFAEEWIGGPAPLAACKFIAGEPGVYDDEIYIGSVYYYIEGDWVTFGQFGYCKNGALTLCSISSNPLSVRLYAGDDTAGSISSGGRICVPNQSAIGPWSDLNPYYQNISFRMYGCQGKDIMRGTPNNDWLVGGSNTVGSSEFGDVVFGLAGNDKICGDYSTFPGNVCYAGSNCSSDYGTHGSDSLAGGYGDDDIWGHGGADTVEYAAPWDTGSNFVNGGTGGDTIYGGNGTDFLWGGDGDDYVWGHGGDDLLSGCNGFDHVYGGTGSDIIREKYCCETRALNYVIQWDDEGDNLYGYDGGWNNTDGCDTIEGWMGNDHIELDGEYIDCPGNDVEKAVGGSGRDTIIAGEADLNILEGDGDDPDDPGIDDHDTIYGGPNVDWIYGDGGPDRIFAGGGDDYIEGNEGDDTIHGGEGCDFIFGGNGADRIYAYDDDPDRDDGCLSYNEIHGGDGDDIIHGSGRNDHMWGDDGLECNTFLGYGGDDWMCTGCEPYREGGPIACSYDPGPGADILVVHSSGSFQHSTLTGEHAEDDFEDQLCYMSDGTPDSMELNSETGDGDCCRCWYGEKCHFDHCDLEDYGPGEVECDCDAGGSFDCTCP